MNSYPDIRLYGVYVKEAYIILDKETDLDNCHYFSYILRISLIEGRLPEVGLKTERVRCPRAELRSAPGRLRASCRPALRPVGGVLPLDWDR